MRTLSGPADGFDPAAQSFPEAATGATDTLQWIVSDHLASASVTANADGSWNSTIQYTAFGEVRASKGLTATKYRYTGQLAQDSVGLDYYVARWYDPVIGHFTSADTIIPNMAISISFDRYGYVNYNPIRSTDPSGHSFCDPSYCGAPILPFIKGYSLSFIGVVDMQGVATAQYVNIAMGGAVSPEILAGIAVQAQWYNPITDLPNPIFGSSPRSGYGYAQASPAELAGRDPLDPVAVVDVIASRIGAVQSACIGCNDFDLFIAGALAQNGPGFDAGRMGYISDFYSNSTNGLTTINWEAYFNDSRRNYYKKSGSWYGTFRQELTNKDYNTQLMLSLYTADYKALGGKLSNEQVEYVNKLVNSDRRPKFHNSLTRIDNKSI